MSDDPDESRKWAVSGVFIPAGLFIGMGIGWAMGHIVQGLLVGLGAGFLAMGITRLIVK